MKSSLLFFASISHSQHTNLPQQPQSNKNIALGIFILTIPFVLIISAILYRKHREKVLHQKVEALERLWGKNYPQ